MLALLAHWIIHVGDAATEQANFGIKTYLVEFFDAVLDDYHSHFFTQLPPICRRDVAIIIKASILTFHDILGYSMAEKTLLEKAYVTIRILKRLLPQVEENAPSSTAPTDDPLDHIALECALVEAIQAIVTLPGIVASPKAINKVRCRAGLRGSSPALRCNSDFGRIALVCPD